jgi:hypothetical protein
VQKNILHKGPPIPYVPKKDSIQEMVSALNAESLKTQLEKAWNYESLSGSLGHASISHACEICYGGDQEMRIDRNCDMLPIYYDPIIVMFVSIQYFMLNKIIRARLF